MTIVEFLLARIAEDEAVAKSAIDPDRPGTHWQWVSCETDTVVALGDCIAAIEEQPISLRTVEEFAGRFNARPLPAFALHTVEEMATAGVGDHIARHDPGRVLAECKAKRAIIETADALWAGEFQWGHDTADELLKLQATIYAAHHDYNKEWAL